MDAGEARDRPGDAPAGGGPLGPPPMGTEVRAADGAVLGRVAAAWPAYVLVEPSPGSPADWWVPVQAVAGLAGGALVLAVDRAEAERRGWRARPPGGPGRPA